MSLTYQGTCYTGRIANESSDRRRVRIFWGQDLGSLFSAYREHDSVQAVFVKAVPYAFEVTLTKKVTLAKEDDVMPLSTKDTISQIKEYIASRGFSYSVDAFSRKPGAVFRQLQKEAIANKRP